LAAFTLLPTAGFFACFGDSPRKVFCFGEGSHPLRCLDFSDSDFRPNDHWLSDSRPWPNAGFDPWRGSYQRGLLASKTPLAGPVEEGQAVF